MSDKTEQWVGIDIGCSFHEACVMTGDSVAQFHIKNTPAGRSQFIKRLNATGCRVAMEATGVYYLDLALELDEAGIEVMVVNPRVMHHYAKAHGTRSSTDTISAKLLADYVQRMEFQPWEPPSGAHFELRAIGRQLNHLVHDRTVQRNRLHALQSSKHGRSKILIQDEKQGIATLTKRIVRLETEAWRLILQSPELKRISDHITSAKGFAKRSAVMILAELVLLPRSLKSKQCACHAGLDVRLKKSGTSVEGRPRLSKWGNAYIRAALYLPVLTAVRHDPIARAHYLRLQRRGKPKMKALGAMMRKYLTGIWATIQTDQPFDTAKLFNIEPDTPITSR